MAAYQQPPRDWFILQELMRYGIEIYKVKFSVEDTSQEVVIGKEDDSENSKDLREIYIVGFGRKFPHEKLVLSRELSRFLDYLNDFDITGLPDKPGESHVNSCCRTLPLSETQAVVRELRLQVTDRDVKLSTQSMREKLAALRAMPSVLSKEEMLQQLQGVCDFDSSNLNKEKESERSGCMPVRTCVPCGHQEQWLDTKSKAVYSEAGKETGVAKDRPATGNSRDKDKTTEEFNAKQDLKTTQESSYGKAAKVPVGEPEVKKAKSNQEEMISNGQNSKNIDICKTDGRQEPYLKTNSNDIDSKPGKETGVEKKLRATEVSDCQVKNEDLAVRVKSGRKESVDIDDGATAETESQGIKGQKASASNGLNLKQQASTKTNSKVTDSQPVEELGVKKELKAAEESDSRRKTKVTEDSSARKKVKANRGSRSEKKAKVTVDESKVRKVTDKEEGKDNLKATEDSDSRKKPKVTKRCSAKQNVKTKEESSSEKPTEVLVDEAVVGKGKGNQAEKESGRPSRKSVRTCWTCGIQEPAPKVFKKCKRCKDEGCVDPPYYCGRHCQVMDWTVRHRQEHEKIYTGDPTTL